jgi:hypothetical protein
MLVLREGHRRFDMAQNQTSDLTSGWTVDRFRAFWGKPDISMVPAIRSRITSDIIGHWPRQIGDILDPDLYLGVIADILTVCPNWSLVVPEYARSGDLHFVRWIATGTGPDGRFEFNGCDRVKTTATGQVCENYIFCDHPFFAQISPSRGATKLKSLARAAG